MLPDDFKRRTIEFLRAKLDDSEMTRAQAEEALGFCEGWLRNRARGYKFDLGDLKAWLNLLDISAVDFFQVVEASGYPGAVDEDGVAEQILAQAAEIWERGDEQKDAATRVTRAELLQLDDRRYYDTAEVLEVLKVEVRPGRISREDLPLALGITGSVLRLQLKYNGAEELIQKGLTYADQQESHLAAGDLHERMSYVWWNRTNYSAAFEVSSHSIARYEDAGSRAGVGRAMVARGMILGSMRRFRWSTSAFENALALLPKTEPRHRCAAYHGLAQNCVETGDLPGAISLAQAANRIPTDPRNGAKLTWLLGSLLMKAGDFTDAISYLRDAILVLEEVAPIDAALAQIELCEAFIQAGRPEAAYQSAREMLRFVGPFRQKPAAQAAAIELATVGQRGKGLTLAALLEVHARISESR